MTPDPGGGPQPWRDAEAGPSGRSRDRDLSSLMRKALEGDERAYRLAIRDIAELARRVAWSLLRRAGFDRSEVDDIVQETLLAFHVHRFEWDGRLKAEPWVASIARYKTIDALRKARVREFVPLDETRLTAPESENPATRLDLERLIAALRPRERELVRSVLLQGFSVTDAAARMSMSNVAVRVALHRAMRAMAAAR